MSTDVIDGVIITRVSDNLNRLFSLIDTTWRNTFINLTKYRSVYLSGTKPTSTVCPWNEIFFLLTEFEIFGKITNANSNEQNKQKQYVMYANGASRIRKSFMDKSTNRAWWEASAYKNHHSYFCCVGSDGEAYDYHMDQTHGLSPACRVG